MSDVPLVQQTRLRPYAGRFDLRINRNRYGLMRHNFKRATETKAACVIKSTIAAKLDNNNNNKNLKKNGETNEVNDRHDIVQIFAVRKQVPTMMRQWNRSDILTQPKRNQPSLYDTTKTVQYKNMDEEMLFETFNHMSLIELCNTAEKCADLKLATQKYFEVIYTSTNLAWLIDDHATKFTLPQARRMLQIFGAFISTLIVNTNQLEKQQDLEELLETIGKHCGGVLFWNSK